MVRRAEELGSLVRERRKQSGATLVEAAGLSGVGIRFLHELERGKQTAALGKVLQVLDRMGLEVWIVPRRAARREPK
jgi:hypothetical protein